MNLHDDSNVLSQTCSLVMLCQIWWSALYMSAQLIYAHQGRTWAMFPTSWHRCWNDNPTCLCAFPQRPALSQHMASVDCRVRHGCQAWDSWSTAVVFLILYSVGGVWSLGTACMFSRARTFSHTHMLILCMRTFTHVYVCVFAQTRSLYLVPFFQRRWLPTCRQVVWLPTCRQVVGVPTSSRGGADFLWKSWNPFSRRRGVPTSLK